MQLVIGHIGAGPRGGELVSVAHYGEQNGDMMRDPEIMFEVAAGMWYPVSIQQDYVGSYHRRFFRMSEAASLFAWPWSRTSVLLLVFWIGTSSIMVL